MISPAPKSPRWLGWDVLRLLRQHRLAAVLLGLLLCAAAAAELSVPFITRSAIDAVVMALQKRVAGAASTLYFSCATILGLAVLTRFLRSVYNYKLFRLISYCEDQVKNAAFANFLHLDTEYQNGVNTGEVIGALDRGSTAVFVILYEILGQNLLPSLLLLIGILSMLATRNPWVAGLVFLPLPAYALSVGRLSGRMHRIEYTISHSFERVTKESFDIASNVRAVKKFARERDEAETQRNLLFHARKHHYAGERLWAFIENIQSLFSNLGRVSVLAFGGFLVLSHRITIGEYVLFLSLQDMVYGPVSQLSILLPKLRRNLSRAERLFEILGQRSRICDSPDAATLAGQGAPVRFENVQFTYSGADTPTLRNINIDIACGSTVALVGPSGSGKSTLMHLLQRLYEPERGNIYIDGHEIRTLTQKSLRDQIAVVPQEVELFSRSIFENIGYGRNGVTREDVEQAARIAEAHDFILRCEQAYDTQVGERGMRLSGGERQRIGIARAVVCNPRILILDEATSHLDNESEHLIQRALEQVTRHRTCFIIAHRLSTIRNADQVIVFADNSIEAAGSHSELLQSSPTYRKLYGLHRAAPADRLELLATAN